jgi:hypothetical protein
MKQALTIRDDEHAGKSAVNDGLPRVARIGGQSESPRCGDGLSCIQQHVEGDGLRVLRRFVTLRQA